MHFGLKNKNKDDFYIEKLDNFVRVNHESNLRPEKLYK